MSERISASKVGRINTCHASANLDLAIPGWTEPVEDRTADNAANRGSLFHDDLSVFMKKSRKDILYAAQIMQYVADLRSTRRFKVLSEESIKATWLASQPDTTPDLVLYVADEIHVLDFKRGDIEVPVIDNEQLLYYDVCVAPLAPKAKGVMNHVLQPSISKFESWFADTNVIQAFMDKTLATEAQVLAGSTVFSPSDECTFCPANPHGRGRKGSPYCPVLMQLHYPMPLDEDEILGDLP
jgi:hypothetical protein